MNRKYAGQDDGEDRQVVIKWLSTLGWQYVVEPEPYGKYDCKFSKNGRELKVEIEYRHEFETFQDEEGWFNFKFKTIHVPARKHKSEADIYCVLNRSRTQVLLFIMNEVKQCPVVDVVLNRTDSLPVEQFYDVPLNGVKWKVVKIVQ